MPSSGRRAKLATPESSLPGPCENTSLTASGCASTTHVSLITRTVNTSPKARCPASKNPYGSKLYQSVCSAPGVRGPGGSAEAAAMTGLWSLSSKTATWRVA